MSKEPSPQRAEEAERGRPPAVQSRLPAVQSRPPAVQSRPPAVHPHPQDSDAGYRALVEHSSAGIWHITPQGKTLFANAALCRLLEATVEEIVAVPASSFFTESTRPVHLREIAKRVTGLITTYEGELVGRRGRRSIVVITGTPVFDDTGRVASTIATLVDVTPQRRAERALEQSLQKLRLVTSAVQMVAWQWDVASDVVTIEYEEDSLEDSGEESALRVFPADRERVKKLVRRRIDDRSGPDLFSMEYRIPIEGHARWRLAHCRVLRDDAGAAQRVVGISVDISERKRLEAELAQANKLESLGRLAGGVAHDFNNLLTVILSAVHLAKLRSDRMSEAIEDISAAAERAGRLTQQLLAFARKQVLEIGVVDVRDLLENLDALLRRVLGERVELRTRCEGDLWFARAATSQLEQVIINLAVNARDAMPEGGVVTVTAVNRTLADGDDDLPGGEYVEITIGDTGAGIPEASKEHIFEPFYTEKPNGTGLGLATCYGIVKQLGGQIRVHSEIGAGSTFALLLPRATHRSADPPTFGGSSLPRGHHQVVLVAEDDDNVRAATAAVLASAGYDVVTAADGAKALALLRDRPDVIVLVSDVVMPRMGGIELAGCARRILPGIKIVLVSGHSDSVAELSSLPKDTRFLQKPYTPERLGEVIQALLAPTAD